jgi:hypothetical protein
MRRGLTASRADLPRITFHDLRHTCASVQNSIDSVSWKVMPLLERSGLPVWFRELRYGCLFLLVQSGEPSKICKPSPATP